VKVAFFTENGFNGAVPRAHENMRVEFAWMCALNATHYNIHNIGITENYDLGIIIVPKKNPQFDLKKIKNFCNKVATMQEGPHWYFQDYDIEKQVWFYNTLMEMDFLFAHNQADKKYYEGLTGKECRVMQSLMIEDSVKDLNIENRNSVMIGGNFCQWYGGFDSYIISQEFGEDIYVPSMGRKIAGEEQMPGLNHLPYMNWVEWIKKLNTCKYGVHLMRTHAAGTFALNCAYLGIPCIGYEGLDSQENCHPNLTVKLGDLASARSMAQKLKEDKEYYRQCSKIAKFNYKQYYSEQEYLKIFSSGFTV
tara:strand:+ start:57 stop:977 length:921 start_codon:yes stop_codon:yes gene_type:complete